MPLAEHEIDIFRYCVNRNENIFGSRNIENKDPDDIADHQDTDIVMEMLDGQWPFLHAVVAECTRS